MVQKAQKAADVTQRDMQVAWGAVQAAQKHWESTQQMHLEYVAKFRASREKAQLIEDTLNQRQFLAQIQQLQTVAAQQLHRAKLVHRHAQQVHQQSEVDLHKTRKLVEREEYKIQAEENRREQREMDAIGVARHFFSNRAK